MILLKIFLFILLQHVLWFDKDDLKDACSWSSPPVVLLRDIHSDPLVKYDCKDSAPPLIFQG